MLKDPIVDEVHAIREAHAKRFGYDMRKIVDDLIKKQAARAATAATKPAKTRKTKSAKAAARPTKRRKAA
jgi:hypothetical protein